MSPSDTRELSSLPGIDYTDRFTRETDRAATPEQWARATFGDVPDAGQLVIWRGILGFRLDRRRAPSTVAGWQVSGRGDDWIRMEATSWLLSANLITRTTPGRVTVTTFVHYRHRLARHAWPPLSAAHRALLPRVLHAASLPPAR
ncbi:hypothetical protein [Actinoplanes sp. NPDC051494]|uniref:hypothetical protein n=1 Tax=Actinoplanes sp. NPDC051494 TaxID=3363907 RepID=UPI0037AA907C